MDCAQQCFGQFRGEKEAELRGWLRAIMRNQVAQLVRGRAGADNDRQQEIDSGLAADVRTPSSEVGRQEEIDSVRAALGKLPEHYQRVIQLHEYEKLSWEEIGQRMGRSPEAVRKLWSRAVDELGKLLKR
jgi:RNA polymerase sigma-70 factor (ECF subfamily)